MNNNILFATDLDGTLLDKSCTVPAPYAARLNKLIANGLLLTAATGRHPRSAQTALSSSGLKFATPAVCLNGAVLWDMEKDIPTAAWYIAPHVIDEVWEIVSGEKVPVHLFACDLEQKTLTTYYLPWIDPNGTGRQLVYTPTQEPPCIFTAAGSAPDKNMISGSYFSNKDLLLPIYQKLKKVSGIRTVFYASTRFSDMCFLEFYADNGGKGIAAREAMKYCPAESLYVFGDSENDIDLFIAADRSFAPANAAAAALEAADETVPTNLEGGVVSTIEKILSAE